MILFLAQWFFATGPVGDMRSLDEANAGVQRVYDAVVAEDGTVDYRALDKDPALREQLDAYVRFAAGFDLAGLESDKARIAFYANTYNVFTLAGVMRAWPVASVRKIKMFFGFFTAEDWSLAGQQLSLNQLEKDYLRPLDPRIHFLINCASASCPKLMPRVFTADNIEESMERATTAFLADPKKNSFGKKNWRLSKIFDWYREDWGKQEDVLAFIHKYRPDLAGKTPAKLTYLDYDWNLNGPTTR